jgi:inositol-phosphate transport system substrate-binding protein
MLALPALANAKPLAKPRVSLTAWSTGSPTIDLWRIKALETNASKVKDFTVAVKGINDSAQLPDFLRKFTLAASAGQGPNIIATGHELAAPWSTAGWIVPFDKYLKRYPDFDKIITALWGSVKFGGRLWGAPIDPEARPMYFNTKMLAQVGWSQAQINALPSRVKTGAFTLADLVNVGRLAVDKGVVPKGFAFWPRPRAGLDFLQYYHAYGGRLFDDRRKKLVVTSDAVTRWYQFFRTVVEEELTPANFIGTEWPVWHSTVADGKTLFWPGGTWHIAEWRTNWIGGKGDPYLESFIGYALQPAGVKARGGTTLSHPWAYYVTSNKASRASQTEIDAAFALLAKAATDKVARTQNSLLNNSLANNKPQLYSPAYKRNKFLSSVTYMLGRAFYLPQDVNFGAYNNILFEQMVRVMQGQVSPGTGTSEAISRLRAEIPGGVIVE